MKRVLILIMTILAIALDFTEAQATTASAFSSVQIVTIVNDYKMCKLNAGKSEEIAEFLADHLENIYGHKINNYRSFIGKPNYDILIRWFACLTKYSNVGGDEELGYATSLCDAFVDSKNIRLRIKNLSKYDRDVAEFRKWLLEYSRNVNVNCY